MRAACIPRERPGEDTDVGDRCDDVGSLTGKLAFPLVSGDLGGATFGCETIGLSICIGVSRSPDCEASLSWEGVCSRKIFNLFLSTCSLSICDETFETGAFTDCVEGTVVGAVTEGKLKLDCPSPDFLAGRIFLSLDG